MKKIVLAVVFDTSILPLLMNSLTEYGHVYTMINSQGGFFRRNSTTLMIGVESDGVAALQALIEDVCQVNASEVQKSITMFFLEASQFLQM
ncbi:MAG: cyclic-di-AMP receptor [Anaerolineae bacterium]|nr:cyclic-di-AMP receptor [Anaerolineae bacterium]